MCALTLANTSRFSLHKKNPIVCFSCFNFSADDTKEYSNCILFILYCCLLFTSWGHCFANQSFQFLQAITFLFSLLKTNQIWEHMILQLKLSLKQEDTNVGNKYLLSLFLPDKESTIFIDATLTQKTCNDLFF